MISYSITNDPSMAVFTVVLMITLSILFYLKVQRRNPNLPPGPIGLPILGCLPFIDPHLHRYFAGLARTYGPVLSLRIGTKLCVVLSSPAVVREALKENDIIFASHEAPSVARGTMLGRSDLLWIPYGPLWRMLRKVSVRELLSHGNIEALRPLRRREVGRSIAKVRADAGKPVEVQELTFLTALNVMTSMLWGVTLDGQNDGDDEGDRTRKELLRTVEDILQLLAEPNISDFFPALEALDLQGLVKKMKQLLKRYEELVKKVMEKKKMGTKEEDEGVKNTRTFYQVILELIERGDPEAPVNMEHLTGLLLDMLSGGTDTTAATTEWAMAELLRHPDMMRRAQEELDVVVGRDRVVEESDLPKLTYLDAVVKETMRLHPLVPLLVPYSASSACVVGGYTIPTEAKVFINVSAIHRDPSIWKDPLEFKPERFLTAADGGDGRKYDYWGNNLSYLPFGSGRRVCVGVSLGERMVMYMLASFLHSFSWRSPDGEKVDVTEKFGIILKKAERLRAIPVPRLEKPELYTWKRTLINY